MAQTHLSRVFKDALLRCWLLILLNFYMLIFYNGWYNLLILWCMFLFCFMAGSPCSIWYELNIQFFLCIFWFSFCTFTPDPSMCLGFILVIHHHLHSSDNQWWYFPFLIPGTMNMLCLKGRWGWWWSWLWGQEMQLVWGHPLNGSN